MSFDDRADLDEPANAHTSGAAILACTLCDEHGYRPNTMVCDHVDREAVVARGRALVQAELDKIRQRKHGGAA